jgi:uncharacterized membrane protein YjgN (DUF898 family)
MQTMVMDSAPGGAAPGGADAVVPEAPPHRIECTATAGEYFRIWVVNLALTLVTLGVYSAWAKVRRNRYLYASARIDGDAFEYRGRPIPILKGRIIAVAVTAVVYSVSHWWVRYFWYVVAFVLVIIPWLMVRSFAFRAHNTAWRNVRMRFDGTYWRAIGLLAFYGLFTVLTLGLGYFVAKARYTEFVVRHHAYGATRFEVSGLRGAFFGIYGLAILLGFAAGVVLGLMASQIVAWTHVMLGRSPLSYVFNLLVYTMYLFFFAYLRARTTNAVNILAILASAGFATPWAVVRTLRYRLGCFEVLAPGGLGGFAAADAPEVSAAGEEVGQMLDFDFSL